MSDRDNGTAKLGNSPKPDDGISDGRQASEKGAPVSFTQGDFEVSVLTDGYISVPGEIFAPDLEVEARQTALSHMKVQNGEVHAQANIPLFRSRRDVILFDIGAGGGYQPSDGLLQQSLSAVEVSTASITKIVFTHAHPDHIAATLAADGTLRFPNATYFVGSAEWDFWMDPDFFNKAPLALHDFGRGAQRDLGAIEERIVLIKPGDDVMTGIRAIATPGHTPGHLSFEVSGGEGLIIAGDTATSEFVSLEHPGWRFGYDVLPEIAIESRQRLLDRATHDRCKMLGFHWNYPGVGFGQRAGTAYRFIPS